MKHFIGDEVSKASRIGLVAKKVTVNRGGKSFLQTVYVSEGKSSDVHTPAMIGHAIRAAGLPNQTANMLKLEGGKLVQGKKMHTRGEIKTALAKHGHTDEEIKKVMEKLGQAGPNNPKKVVVQQVAHSHPGAVAKEYDKKKWQGD